MAKVTVDAGICNFKAVIEAVKNEDTEMVEVKFNSGCPNFKQFNGETLEFDALEVCFEKLGEGEVFETLKPSCPHSACPFPTAMIKAIEVAEGLALPKDVIMQIEK